MVSDKKLFKVLLLAHLTWLCNEMITEEGNINTIPAKFGQTLTSSAQVS